jgi:hypothetical protein
MSTRTALHIIEAAADHERHAPELGQIQLGDVIQHSEPRLLRQDIRASWQVIGGLDVYAQPYSDYAEVVTTYDKFTAIDDKVRAHLDESEALSMEERIRAHEVWDHDADAICEIAGRLSILGSYLRERKNITQIHARDRTNTLRTFKLNPYTSVKIGLNTMIATVLNRLEKHPDEVELSEGAKASKRAMRSAAVLDFQARKKS